MYEYADYLQACLECGQKPLTESEYWALVEEEKMEGWHV